MATGLEKMLQGMGLKSKEGQTKEEVQEWMITHLQAAGKLPEAEPKEVKPVVGTGYHQSLKLCTFSGDVPGKGDTTFDLWHHNVSCLLAEGLHPESAILEAVRRSLKGDAAKIVKRQGTGMSVTQILNKLEAVYGIVEAGDTLHAEFYAAQQRKDETVVSWGLRVEDMFDKMCQRNLADAKDTEKLRGRFWNGLQRRLKDSTRHKFDTIMDLDELRVEVRKIEREFSLPEDDTGKKLTGTAKMADTKVTDTGGMMSEMTELKGLVHRLTNKVEGFQKDLQSTKQGSRDGHPAPELGQHWHSTQQQQQQLTQQQQQQPSQQGFPPSDMGYWQGTQQHHQQQMAQQGPPQSNQGSYWQGTPTQQYIQQQHALPDPPAPRQGGQRQQPSSDVRQQGYWYGHGQQAPPGGQQRGTGQPPGTGGCFKCGSPDHWKRDCPHAPVCYNCQERGHVKRYCPRSLNM
jgi:hypothetical protein